jgi:hypothetical protein
MVLTTREEKGRILVVFAGENEHCPLPALECQRPSRLSPTRIRMALRTYLALILSLYSQQ